MKSIEERTRENLPKRLKGTVLVYASWMRHPYRLICPLFLEGVCQKNDYSTTVCQIFPYSNIFCRRFSILKGECRVVEHNKHADQLLLNETKQNHYYFLHFLNCYNLLKWLCCTQEVVICRGSYPSDMYNPRLTNGEEKKVTLSVCCHLKLLLPWQRDVTTSLKVFSHYFKLYRSYSVSFNLANLGEIFFGTVSIVI